MSDLKYVGTSTVRVDGAPKVMGAATYVDDMDFGGNLIYAQVVESPHAHALIKGIDTSEAEAVPGVIRVVTGEEFPFTFGLYMQDRYVFARDRVRFVGEQVAAVLSRDPRIAMAAAKLVKVDYEVLPNVLDLGDALKNDAVLVHENLADYEHVPWFFPRVNTNIAHWRKTRKGDIKKGFAEADVIIEDTYEVPRYAHCPIEVHAIVGLYDHSGRLTLWSGSQSPFTQRNVIAEALKPLGLSHHQVRVITPFVGGGFGGKAGVSMEIIAAAVAMVVRGNPVKVLWSRAQEFYNTYQRQGVLARVKLGAKKDGTITAIEHDLHWDAGAYVEYGANVVNAVGLSATGAYRVPNVKIDSLCVYTNLPPGGPYRGFGYSEFHFGLESHMTRMAKQLGMDPIEFRRKNAIRGGDTLCYGAEMNENGLLEAIDKVSDAIEWGTKEESADENKVIGKGFSCFWKAPAMPPNASSAAFLKFNEDGSINITVSGMELGQGYLTVMAQVVAEVLTVPPNKIRVETPDTDRNPYEWQTVASHVTWSCGNAVKKAAVEAKEKMIDVVHRARGFDKDDLYLDDEKVKSKSDASFELPFSEFVINGIMTEDGTFRGGPIVSSGMFMPEFASALSDPETSQGGHPNVHYTVGAAGVIVEIDKDTGKMHIKRAVLAVDAGKALNPSLVNGQIVGGMLQGIATVLYEEIKFDKNGKLVNCNFTDYKLPTSLDVPDEVIPIIIEVEQPDGPFGARGIAEHTMIPAAGMIANAVEDALGIRLKTLPITAEKVALALNGINYEDVRGDFMGLCFMGDREKYDFDAVRQT
ncbi:MAG: xanthine dehydrogenase family protein molybdopterin-binding subunit [Verrucomicrobia bacterium]|nr:xanthine dehydrogenase family protein molybdopterin-binding subunit [Verrucomicrobiota bacterium]